MSEPRGKSVADRIAELRADLEEKIARLELAKPGLKTTLALSERCDKIRAQIEELEPLASAPNLSDSCKSYLKMWLSDFVTGKRVEFSSKQTHKGNVVEDDAITYASIHVPEMGLCAKNEQTFKNKWLRGTPDVITDEWIFDLKSSYTHRTFPLFDSEIPESDYEWQVLGYMSLTGRRKGAVIYALMSMPEDVLQREARYKLGEGYTQEEYEAYRANYVYDDLPVYQRLRRFDVEYDEAKIEAMQKRVEQCQVYIDTVLWPQYLKNMEVFTDSIFA